MEGIFPPPRIRIEILIFSVDMSILIGLEVSFESNPKFFFLILFLCCGKQLGIISASSQDEVDVAVPFLFL